MTTGEKNKTILLVEDEGIIALAEAKMLQGYGYRIVTAPSGEKAVEIFNRTPDIDLVLMDINLGSGMDGTQAAEIILSQQDIPLIFLSSHTEPQVVEKTEGITSYGYVVKGSGETVLIASIQMAFRLFEARMKEKQKDIALQESEARWRTLVQNLPYFVVEADTDGIIQALNRVQSGFSLEDYIGKSLFDVVVPESREQFRKAFEKVLEEGKIVEYEASGYGANREPAWYHRQLVPIIQNGEIHSILMVANDITERKQAEEKLKQSERQLNIITDTIPAYVAYVGLDDLRYRFVNTRFEESYKIPREKIIGSHIKEIIGQSNYEFAQKYLEIVKQGESTSYENSFVTAGTRRWVNVNYVPEMNEEGEPEAVVVLSFDITERKQMENLLKERQERLRMIFDTMTEGVALNEIVYDKNGDMVDYRVLEVNSAYYTTADFQGDEAVGNLATKLYGMTPEFVKAFWEEHKKKDATAYAEMFRPVSKKWYAITTSPFFEDKFVTTFIDITELKQIQEQLRFQAGLLDTVEQAVIVTDVDGHVIFWNPFAEQLYGWSAEEALGKTTIDLIASEQSQQQGVEIMARLRAGKSWSGEYQVSHRNGTSFHIQSTISPAFNEQGELSHIIGLSSDIEERKQSEKKLLESKEYIEHLNNTLADAIITVGLPEREIEYVNSAAEKIFGFSAEDCIGQKTVIFYPGENDYIEFGRKLTIVIEKGRGFLHTEQQLKRKSGELFPAEITTTFLREGERLTKVISIIRDITERKQAEEELQEAFKEKQNLLKELQHRAKNSFALISSLTSLMTEAAREEEARALLDELGGRVRALSQLYDLLYVTESVIETELDVYFSKITTSFLSSENIRFMQSYETVTVPVKTAAALGLVVTELVTNAVKHAFPDNKQGTISISLRKSDTGATIEVADDGVGFSDRFDLASSHTLGLTIVQSLTQQIQGNFQIKHSIGTHCIVEFPLG